MKEVDSVLETPFRHGALQLRERWNYAQVLRARGYADAYVLPNTLKYALIPWLAGIPRTGRLQGRDALWPAQRHAPRRQAAAADGAVLRRAGRCAARPAARQRCRARADGERRADRPGARARTASRSTSRWWCLRPAPSSVRQALAGRALRRAGARDRGARTRARRSRCLARRRTATCATRSSRWRWQIRSGVLNLAGATKLDEAIALIASADAVVANDSGLLHVASALNRPVLAIYGPTDPDHAPPFSDMARSMSLRLECSPCRQRECPLGHHACMRELVPTWCGASCARCWASRARAVVALPVVR